MTSSLSTGAPGSSDGRLAANLLCMASMLVWATAFPAVELLVGLIPPVPLTALRMCLAVGFLLPLWLWREGAGPLRAARWGRGLWIGGIGFGLGAGLLVIGQQMTDAVTMAVVSAMMPVVGIALECLLDGRRLTLLLVCGLVLSLAGGVVAYAARLGGMGFGPGALLALGSVLAFCWASRLTVRGFPDLSVIGQTTVTLTGAALSTSVAALLLAGAGGAEVQWGAIGAREMGALLVYGIGSLALSQLLWIAGVARLGIGVASMHINAAPFYVMAFMFALGQPWIWGQVAGALVVAVGVLVAQRG